MASYYVNKSAQPNGDHEVHTAGCRFLPDRNNRVYLGDFGSSRAVVRKAEEQYDQVNGCYYCAKECHSQ